MATANPLRSRRAAVQAGMVAVVATYQTILTVPQSVDVTFAFVSDFRNAARWDPRTYSAVKTTEGPVGVGTRFVLTGGILREDVVSRLHLPMLIAGMPLPYDVVEFDTPNGFVLEGESRILRWRDRLEFSADGSNTRLRYFAELEFKGPLVIAEPLLRRMFRHIGDDATKDLAATVTSGL